MKKTIFFLFFIFLFFTIKSQIIVETIKLPYQDNLVTKYNLIGDGITDNSYNFNYAIQQCRNSIYGTNTYKRLQNSNVLYLPAGTYCLNSTVIMKGRIGLSIIGENPENTFIKWTGGNDDTCLLIANSAYIKVSRISFIKNNQTGVSAIGSKYLKYGLETDSSRSWSPTSMEYSDLKFYNYSKGLDIGTFYNERPDNVGAEGTGTMDSEFAMYRNQFFNCETGINIKGQNALDHWIWDSYFYKCGTGINNNGGNFHVYNSFFNSSLSHDLHSDFVGYYISVRNCISIYSARFWGEGGFSTNPHKRIFQGNSVFNTKYVPIEYYHTGGFELFDNKFYNIKNQNNPEGKIAIIGGLWGLNYPAYPYGNYNILSVNNIYPSINPINIERPVKTIYSFNDVLDTNKKIIPYFKNIIYRNSDKIVIKFNKGEADSYIWRGNTFADSLQNVIDNLDYLSNKKYIFYFPSGVYYLNHKITIPTNANIEFKGDGMTFGTTFSTTYAISTYTDNCFFEINYPAKCNFYDIGLTELGNGSGLSRNIQGIKYIVPNTSTTIKVNNDQQYGGNIGDTSLLIKIGATKVIYVKTSSFFSDNNSLNNIRKYYSFGGQYIGSNVVKSNMVSMDCWWEGSSLTSNLKGDGNIVISSGMLYPSPQIARQQTLDFKNFKGNLYLTNFRYSGRFGDSTYNYNNLNVFSYNVDNIEEFNPSASFTKFNKSSLFGSTYSTRNDDNPNNVTGLQPSSDYTNDRVYKNKMILDYYTYMNNALLELKSGVVSNNTDYYYKTSRISFNNLKYHFAITN